MRVLLLMIDIDRVPGGARTQFEQTARHLRAAGIEVDVSFEMPSEPAAYTLVHGFGLRPNEIRAIRRWGVPVALSTIYLGREALIGLARNTSAAGRFVSDLAQRVRTAAVLSLSAMRRDHLNKCAAFTQLFANLRATYECADLLLPNSRAEAKAIESELLVSTPWHVVPNGVDHTKFSATVSVGESRNSVLYVGRFEPHKNQLALIKAMRGSAVEVVLIGPPHPDHPRYYETCRQMARGTNVVVRSPVAHEELPNVYRQAKVHVLPSWSETTGLVSLEAALCGCNVVTTDRVYVKDYFKDLVWYCDPASPRSIRRAVEAAFEADYRGELRDYVLSNFTWEHTARETIRAYESLVQERCVDRPARKIRLLGGTQVDSLSNPPGDSERAVKMRMTR